MENIEQLKKKVAVESMTEIENRISQLKRDIYDLGTKMDFINSFEPENTSKEQFEMTMQAKQDELAGLEKSIKIVAQTSNPNYVPPIEETVGSFKSDGTPIIPLEEKMAGIIMQVDSALKEIKTEKNNVTEDMLKNLTHEVNQQLYREDTIENKTQLTKLQELTKLLTDNEASFEDQFPGLDINDDKPIVFNDPHYQREYEILRQENKNLKEDILHMREELEHAMVK
jgi:hypothetical protein